MNLLIGIQGIAGSISEQAAELFAAAEKWRDYSLVYLITSDKVCAELSTGAIHYGVCAWKSSRAGLVVETQQALEKYSVQKVSETTIDVRHALLCRTAITIEQPLTIYSHPQAIAEHSSFLRQEFPQLSFVEEHDTALAAKNLSAGFYRENSLVLAPFGCAKLYNLEIYREHLPTNEGYQTTFWLVKKKYL